MKCPKCGFENRPDARFCKQCGQPLQAPAAPPPAEQPCPRCGAINKPGARFCARCGAPLAPPAPSPAPPAAPPPTPPAAPPPAYGPPSPPPPVPPAAPPPAYGPPSPPPPGPAIPPSYIPSPEPEPARRFPRWLWIILPIAPVLCLVVAGVLGYSAYRQGKLPFLRPGPTSTAAPTATPAPEMTEAPSPTPGAPALAPMEVVPSAPELKVGEPLTLTVTVTNTGDRPWARTEYRLLGGWEPMLELAGSPEPSLEELLPGANRPVTFTLTARQEGSATLKVLLLVQTGGDRPEWEAVISEEVSIHVVP